MDDPELRWTKMPPPDLVLVTKVGPVPTSPPLDLAAYVTPSRAADGSVNDWALRDADPGSSADVADRLAAASAFSTWRSEWERRHPVGPARELAVLRSIAATVAHGEAAALDELLAVLLGAPVSPTALDPSAVRACLDELDDVRTAIEIAGGAGSAIHDAMPDRGSDRALRTWSPPAEAYVIAASPSTVVRIDPRAGLVVETVETVEAGASRPSRFDDVVEVDLTDGRAVLTDRAARRGVLDPAAARPVGWIAPPSLRWRVNPIPLVDVWWRLFETLPRLVAEVRAGDAIGVTTSTATSASASTST